MVGDEVLRAAMRSAIAEVVRQHLPDATGAGRLGGYLVTFDWVDIGPGSGEHVIVDGRDPRVAVRSLSRALAGGNVAGAPGSRLR
jgi:hypothetical protein